MQIYQGKSVFSGIAIGKIRVYKKNERQVKRVKVENPDAEMARFEEAKAKGIAQLGVLYEKACMPPIAEIYSTSGIHHHSHIIMK